MSSVDVFLTNDQKKNTHSFLKVETDLLVLLESGKIMVAKRDTVVNVNSKKADWNSRGHRFVAKISYPPLA